MNLNDVWYALSAGVLKNCKIKKLYASRQKRYFENSKVNFLKLVEHSLRIISVFYKRMFISSFLLTLIIWTFTFKLSVLFYLLVFFINLIVILVKIKNYTKLTLNLNSFIKEIKII